MYLKNLIFFVSLLFGIHLTVYGKIIIDFDDPKINVSKKSKDINKKDGLGAFLSKIRTESNSLIKTREYQDKINIIDFHDDIRIIVDSEILIASEIIHYPCTLNRTIDHEKKHANFLRVVLSERSLIYEQWLLELDKKISSLNGNKIYIQEKSNDLFQKIQQDIIHDIFYWKKKLDETIDNPSNYLEESLQCSEKENNRIKSIL